MTRFPWAGLKAPIAIRGNLFVPTQVDSADRQNTIGKKQGRQTISICSIGVPRKPRQKILHLEYNRGVHVILP